jgi:hypothetical protein
MFTYVKKICDIFNRVGVPVAPDKHDSALLIQRFKVFVNQFQRLRVRQPPPPQRMPKENNPRFHPSKRHKCYFSSMRYSRDTFLMSEITNNTANIA